jgi:hypothetical protein
MQGWLSNLFLDQGGSQLIYYFLESVAQRLDPQLSEA